VAIDEVFAHEDCRAAPSEVGEHWSFVNGS